MKNGNDKSRSKTQATRRSSSGFVYLIGNARRKRLKIGWSVSPERRLRSLQSATADRLRILATFPGTMEDERLTHSLFRSYRIRYEWFNAHATIIAFFSLSEAARAAEFDRQRSPFFRGGTKKRSITIRRDYDIAIRELVGAREYSEFINDSLATHLTTILTTCSLDELNKRYGVKPTPKLKRLIGTLTERRARGLPY